MDQSNDPEAAKLEAEWPGWHIWTVPLWSGTAGGTAWCAKRNNGTGLTLNMTSREDLVEALRARAEGERARG